MKIRPCIAPAALLALSCLLASAPAFAAPELSVTTHTGFEGDSGTAGFTFGVKLSEVSGSVVTVKYRTHPRETDTAVLGEDYEAVLGDLTFAPGETFKSFVVPVNGDTAHEGDEKFRVGIYAPSGATISKFTALGTIKNDDAQPVVSIGPASAAEGNSGTTSLAFPVTLTPASGMATAVTVRTQPGASDTAVVGEDYTETTTELVFAPGETQKAFVVPVAGDTAYESTEQFTVAVSAVSNATLGSDSATGTIENDDALPSLSVATYAAEEGDSGTVDFAFRVKLSAASAFAVTVKYRTQPAETDTAVLGEDYEAVSGELSFAPGEVQKTFTVPVNGDTAYEGDEKFRVGIYAPSGAAVSKYTALGTIVNDDELTVSIANASADESAGTIAFTVTLSSPAVEPVTVDYATADGTATAADYEGGSGTLTIPTGGTSVTLVIPVLDDTIDEADETFTVGLSNAQGATIENGLATGTIVDDDETPPPTDDTALAPVATETAARGCDFLDPSNCLYPFPNNFFTVDAADESPQSTDQGGTGRRVNFNIAAMPRNTAGKPVDPTEWNRSDGFSPGALITTYVPGLSLEKTFDRPSHEIGLANLALSQDPDSPILVLEVRDGLFEDPAPHLVWAEVDQNANQLTVVGAPNVGTQEVSGLTDEHGHVMRPQNDGKAALLIRPAKNFAEGKRYVVVLRKLKDAAGNVIAPQAGFRACIAGDSALPPVQQRCAKLAQDVFPVLEDAGIDPAGVYLAWDFTVQSTNSAIGRLRHMRDDAFASLSSDPADEDCTQLTEANAATCAAPVFQVTNVRENPQTGIARRIEGTITVPSYLVPFNPAPADAAAVHGAIHTMCDNAGELEGDCRGDFREVTDLAQGATAPNRLFYRPGDGAVHTDPSQLPYGDGLPDSTGSMQARFLCQISGKATPDTPARASLYGHGQLDRGIAITYEGVPEQTRDHNYMFCAVDWFGFRTGDAANVLSTLVDLSNFAVVPDASQQGMLNFMFLARAMQHPRGFGALPEFQDAASGRPLFDRSEIFYDGNSQGGIFGGVVLAASKDVNRGVLGALGMNYSTLLTRSANFDEYAGVLYSSYTDPLDRQLLFSMIQMLWDRSENDGYASHLHDNSAFGGPSNTVMLAPAFGDPQVSMWTADIMARTIGDVPFDMQQTLHVETLGAQHRGVNGRRHPDVEPHYQLPAMDFGSGHVNGSVLQVWDNNQRAGQYADVPPITNTPPYSNSSKDPHDTSQRTDDGRCVHAHFMRTGGTVIDAMPLVYGAGTCPPIPPATPTVAPGAEPPPAAGFDPAAALGDWIAALQTAFAQLTGGDPAGAAGTAFGATGNLVAGVYAGVTQAIAEAAGFALPPPTPGAVDNPPPEPLLAGVARRAIEVPVGVPLGGYLRPPVGGEYIGDDAAGELTDNIPVLPDGCDQAHPETCQPLAPIPDELRTVHSPYATYFPPSRGYYDSLVAKAVALHDGHDYIVFVKMDFIGMLDEVVQAVKQDVKARTGIDLGAGLIMSATHTHDGPGALANHSTRYFWLAMDAYQPELFERLVPQVADLVVDALNAMQPARFGHALGREADGAGTGRTVNSYRNGHENVVGIRAENDDVRRRLGVLRVDALDGTPLALVMNYAAHGIAFDVENLYFSGDVLGAAEREVEQTFATPVVAMLVQNTGGNVSPRADGGPTLQRIERFGKLLAPQVRAVYDGIAAFDAQPDLRAVSQRIVLNRDTIGYPDADGKNGDGDYPYPWGAAQCNGAPVAVPSQSPVDCIVAPPPDPQDLADNGVAENGAFVPGDTIMTAAKIGDAMILAQPGEPLTEYGVRVLKAAAEQNLDPAKTYIWGYAQDHVGYLLADDRTDWERGQTEGTTTFWGWKLGDRLLKANVALMQSLRDGTPAPAHEFQVDYFYRDLYKNTPRPPVTPSLLPGVAITQPRDIARFEATRFVFEGGDPVLDLPRVTMLHGDGTPVRRANGEILDTFFEAHLKYRLVNGQHLWTVEFEAPKDWAAGTYRFSASGRASQGTEAGYELESNTFTVAPATTLQVQNASCADGACSVRIGYTPVPTNYRLVDALVNSGDSAPLRTGFATFSNGVDTVTVPADGSGNFTAAIGGAVIVTAVDAWGNSTPGAGGPPPPDSDGDGVPDADDQCPDTPAGTPVNASGCPQQQFPVRFDELCAGPGCLSDLDVIGLQAALDAAWDTVFGGGTPPVVQDPIDPLVFDCTGPAGDPAEGTPEFALRDAENIFCSMERHQDTMSQPANNPYMAENYGADPYRAATRWADELHRGRHNAETIAGAEADIYRPCTAASCTGMPAGLQTFEPPYPVAIVMHGLASDKNHLQWASQPLAERGYFVVAINGTGSNIPTDVLDWLHDPTNPYKADLDLSRVGTTGHSLGAENATRVQGDPRVSGIVAWDNCDGSGGNECRDSSGSRLHDRPNAATPTLFLTADYLGFPGYPQPQTSVPGDLRVEGFGILRDKGVDTMLVTPRATTHLDWAGAFTFGNRLNEATSLYYTLAWFDRYVNGKLVVDGAGNAVTSHGRSEGEERAYRQAIVDAAFTRLTASNFDGLVDLHNISQGRWDRLKALASGDMEFGGNVPYRVAGLDLKDRLSFYHRSVCYIGRPDLMNGQGSALLTRADTTEDGDMRATGCSVAQAPSDRDSDGVPDAIDAFPDDPAESADADGDGIGDNADADDDNDGVADGADQCVNTPAGTTVGADGCPVEQGGGFPYHCDPYFGSGYCLENIPLVGGTIGGALDTAWNTLMGGGEEPPPPVEDASCASGAHLGGNRHYNVTIDSESGETISFEVYEPKIFDCANAGAGAHPLVLQGHGFGGQRTSSDGGFADYRNDGYTVISIDQRGFGQSTGTVRVMDPDFEGKDLVRILDWAETNLDYLAYRDELAADKAFVARPAGGSTASANLVVGAMGGSYGGGFQFLLHNVDDKDRLDALAADVTWHDLRYSLNPGDALKSAFGVLLSVGGEQGSYQRGIENAEDPTHRGLDPYIVETLGRASATGEFPREALAWFNYHSPSYWCGLNGEPQMPYGARENAPVDPNTMLGTAAGEAPGANTRSGQAAAAVLLSQGFRDTLFNFNDAWWNYQCAKVRGGDARLITHQSGHILNPASLISSSIPQGTPLDIQAPPGSGNCGALSKDPRKWFKDKLKGQGASTALAPTLGAVCMSLSDNDAVFIPDQDVLAPKADAFSALLPAPTAHYYSRSGLSAAGVPQGLLAQNLYLSGAVQAAIVPLLTVADARGLIVAGIPQATLTVDALGGVAGVACAAAGNGVPTTRTGCDSALFVGLGYRRGAADWVLIDDQLTPVRGIGTHHFSLAGVAERLADGDELALMVYGYHPQYLASYSRDPLLPAVDLTGSIELPLYAVGTDGKPDFTAASAASVVAPAPPMAVPVNGEGLADCVLNQDPAGCADALASFESLADCPFDESGINCAFNVAYDALGVDTAVGFVRELLAQCADNTVTTAACERVRSNGPAADQLAVLSESVQRGNLIYTTAPRAAPSTKTVDGDLSDWVGEATRIGGTDVYEFGEHIYSDFLFDSFGADNGDDARRMAVLGLAGDLNSRTERIDALQQAANDQLDVPAPAGSSGGDRYGDTVNRPAGSDLTEVRWAADASDLYVLARVANLANVSQLAVLILADTESASGMTGLDAGLGTGRFDRAVILRQTGSKIVNLVTGETTDLAVGDVAINAAGYVNAVEARLPRAVLAPDGALRVAVVSAVASGSAFTPANVAYRFDEPVTIYSERAQALSLFARNIDGFVKQIPLANLTDGVSQAWRPGPGYHERQFISGANISNEADTENGRLQPYGLYVPQTLSVNLQNQARLSIWTHYRGGKAHSGAAWTPRLFHQLGDEQGNLVVSPRGRGTSTWYTTRAHQDFFEVFADVAGTTLLNQYADENLPADHEFTGAGLFNVDPARVTISGYSMGGYASYLFGGLYPDLFSASYPTSGAVTQGAWTGIGPEPGEPGTEICSYRAPDDMPEIGGGTPCFIEANEGRANAQLNFRILENLRHVPLVINHGTNDELALTPGAVRMGKRMLELGYRYDMTTFLGYEHFTQAIVDEWADAAHYINAVPERPENPRVVTYKVVPALVKAVNEVNPQGQTGGFRFNPDGAYWVDGLVVRTGAEGDIAEGEPVPFGQIDAESGRLPGFTYQAVPRTGTDATAEPPSAYVSTPVYSPGHTTPYVRTGLDWIETGVLLPYSNTFTARFVNLSHATLDLQRMGFTGPHDSTIEGIVTTDGATRLTLANVLLPRTLCVNGVETGIVAAGEDAVAELAAGESSVRLPNGLHASCAAEPPPPPYDPNRPDYADLCVSFGVAGSEPVCGALRDAERQLRENCEAKGGNELCTLTGGNLHALVEACYAKNLAESSIPACRVLAAFVESAAGYCREVSTASGGAQPAEFCALIGGVLISEGEIAKYEASWVHRALALQNRLGYGLPLAQATLLHTHNSFNAMTSNTPPTLSGSDFNQHYSMSDQLRMDIRAIEMDVHWMPGAEGSADTLGFMPMLCHGRGGNELNAGCTHERPLRAGLAEFRAWIDAHPDEVVMLYIEDDLGGSPFDRGTAHDVTAQVVEDEIGELVYRPAEHGSTCGNSQTATAAGSTSWLTVSRKQMLEAGKQVLLITESCAGGAWNDLFHQKNDGNWTQGTQGSYAGFSYEGGCRMPDDPTFMNGRGAKYTRIWEDSTMVTAAGGGAPASVTPEVTRELIRCGLSLPGFDRLTPDDGRLAAAVWSWLDNQPAANTQLECALHNGLGRFGAAACEFTRPFACVSDADSNAWVVAGNGAWSAGASACPAGYHFSVPANGYSNERLKEAKAAAGQTTVWLNYAESSEGEWVGDATGAPPGAGPPAPSGSGFSASCQSLGAPALLCDVLASLVSEVSEYAAAASRTLAPEHPFAPAEPLLAACRDNDLPDPLCARAEDVAGGGGLSRWVDPRIGSYPPGFSNPGPVAPWGMVALGPDTEGPLNYGGYYAHNTLVSGFSHVHMSAGVYKGGYIPVLPFTGERTAGDLEDVHQGADHPMPAYSSPFDHATESADAGYYAVTLARYGVFAELTATERAGFHRYTFNDPAQAPRVLIDVARTLGGYHSGSVRLASDALLGSVDSGHGFPVFFAARVNAPFTATTFGGAAVGAGTTALSGADSGVILDFAPAAQPVLVKVGLSYTDEAGALANLDAEIPGWDFEAVRRTNRGKWDAALAAIEVEGGTLAERVSFYTALYRLQHFPNLHSDVDGRYRGPDGQVHGDARPHYSQFSSWDSYRGQNQMQAELFPQRYDEMVRSLLAFHEQAGFLPRWQEGPKDASHMSGDPIIPFIGEAWCRGSLEEPLRAALWPALANLAQRRDAELGALGYLAVGKPEPYFEAPSPFEPLNDAQAVMKQVEGGSGRAGTTLEYGIADFALALMAQSAAVAEAGDIAQRSLNYRNLLDPETGWTRPRHADGSWLTPFAPELGYGFQEGTSWQYSWLAMHDYAGLIEGMGGESEVNLRLDQFFNLPAVLATPVAWPTVQNQATAFGIAYYGNQYAPGNEHDLEAPYVYNYSGEPWKTQAVARAAASIYTPTTNGLPGNDDLGALSGWLVWTMSGLYPMNPGTPLVVVGSPVFEKVTLKRPGGDLVIEAPGASVINKYVQSVAIDGVPSASSWMVLPRESATVRIEMGPAPNLDLGVALAARPPSLSTHGLAAFGCDA